MNGASTGIDGWFRMISDLWLGFSGDFLLGIWRDFMRTFWRSNVEREGGFNAEIMGFNGDLMEIEWVYNVMDSVRIHNQSYYLDMSENWYCNTLLRIQHKIHVYRWYTHVHIQHTWWCWSSLTILHVLTMSLFFRSFFQIGGCPNAESVTYYD